jgi:hypothetical protein
MNPTAHNAVNPNNKMIPKSSPILRANLNLNFRIHLS